MNEHETSRTSEENMEALQVGQRIPGLLEPDELPEGSAYWGQVIDSPYGTLKYSVNQYRDGMLRWQTEGGDVVIRVKSGTGEIVDIAQSTDELPISVGPGETINLESPELIAFRERNARASADHAAKRAAELGLPEGSSWLDILKHQQSK